MRYDDAVAALLTATTPTYVVLDVFSPASGNTDGTEAQQVYRKTAPFC